MTSTSGKAMVHIWSWKMPLCMMLALALVTSSQAQTGGFFAELPPAIAPEVLVAAPTPSEVPVAAPAEVIVPAAAPEIPVAAPAEIVVPAGPAGAIAAAPVPSQEAPVLYTSVDFSDTPFSTIQVCWPFNTYIQPGDNYTVDVIAEDVVLQAIIYNVTDDGTLQLSTEGDFRSPYPIQAIVSVPFFALTGVFVPSPSAEVTVGAGFVAGDFTVSAPFASQDLNVVALTAETLRVQNSGLGRIYVDGDIGNATVAASSSGDVYIIGLADTAVLNLAGTMNAYIQGMSESTVITGQASGINSVVYQHGSCFLTTPFLFGSPCQQTVNNFVPTIEPLWTCGLRVTGDFTCPAGGIQQAQTLAAAGLLPLAARVTRVPSPPPPSPPPPSPPPVVQLPAAAALQPPAAAALQPPSPFLFASPSPNIVSRVGSGPQFAGASGTGNQVASAVSGPGLQQNNVGTNSPDLLNTPGFTDGLGGGGFSGFGKRRLQQSFFGSATTASSGGSSGQSSSSGVVQGAQGTIKSTRPFPCYYDAIGGYDTLSILQNGF